MRCRKIGSINTTHVFELILDSSCVDTRVHNWDLFDLLPKELLIPFVSCKYRGVSLGRWDAVHKNGIDVEPSTAPIYVDNFHKATEYGGWPKLIMGFRADSLDRPFREVPADTPEEEVAELMKTFPTKLTSKDGSKYWLSKLKANDPRICSYERDYGAWIPGSAFDALQFIFFADLKESEWPSIGGSSSSSR